jgi:hypothetical protein
VKVTGATLLATMLSGDVRVGTSTPGANPSGDYAWALFDRAEAVRPGAASALRTKALQLTAPRQRGASGGPEHLRLGHGGGAGRPVTDLLHQCRPCAGGRCRRWRSSRCRRSSRWAPTTG